MTEKYESKKHIINAQTPKTLYILLGFTTCFTLFRYLTKIVMKTVL